LEKQVDLRAVEVSRQMAVELRRADGTRGIRLHDLVPVHPAVEAAHRRERARHRPLAESSPGELREKAAHREPIDALPGPGRVTVVVLEELDE
jgi:hypothetical protein